MTDETRIVTLPEFTPALPGFRTGEFLALSETLLAFPIEQDQAQLDAAPFRLDRPEPLPEALLPVLPARWYPRPVAAVVEVSRASLVAPPRPAIFEGRANELTRVLRPLLSGHPVQVRGEAGIGKTTLLTAVATHERTRQRFRRIWWFDEPARLEQTLALALDLPHILSEPDADRRRALLAAQLDDHTLLIIDNLRPDDVVFLNSLTAHILAGVETAPDPPLSDEPPEDLEGVVTLRVLDETGAIDALALHAGLDDTRRLRGVLSRIATALGRHPYALVLAGTLVQRDGLTLDELNETLAIDALLDERPQVELPDDTDRTDPGVAAQIEALAAWYMTSLNRALDVSLEALPRDYARLFAAFGAFPPTGAPLDGLQAVARIGSSLATRRALLFLEAYGLIRCDHRAPTRYVMHAVAYAQAHEDPAESAPGKKMRDWALRYARSHAGDPLALYRAESSLRHAVELAAEHGPAQVAEQLPAWLAGYLREYAPGAPGEAIAVIEDDDSPRAEGTRLLRLGLDLTNQGAFHAAQEALERALELRRTHDSAHATAEALVALGRLYDAQGDYDEAEAQLVEAAELAYNLGADASVSVIRRGLARVYRHLGRLNDALGVLDDAPEAHLERAAVLRAQANYEAAVQEMMQAGEATPYARAEIFVLAGRYAEALDVIAGQDDPAAALLRAQVFHLQGSVEEAVQGYRLALECCPPVEDGDDDDDGAHSHTRTKTLRGLGAALASAERYDEAQQVLEEALAIQREMQAPVLLGRTLRLLAAVHLAAGEPQQAADAARSALEALAKGNAPQDAAEAYRTLGRALWRMADFAAAQEAFEQEVAQAQSIPKRNDARIGMALHHVAESYRANGELDRAVANLRRALTHHNTASDARLVTQLALHRVLLESERVSAALDVIQEVVDHLARQRPLDLRRYGYAQVLRARTQQAMQRPIRAEQSVLEWARVLTANGERAANADEPALPLLALGLAVRSLLAEDRPSLAVELAERAQALADVEFAGTPVAWAAQRDLGEAYMTAERMEEAIITLEPLLDDAVRQQPATFALAHELTGMSYRKLGEAGNALAHLRVALRHEPELHNQGLLHDTIGQILLDLGQPADAVENWQAALPLLNRDTHPDVAARVLTALAHTLGGLNRYGEAIGVYEEALIVLRDVSGVDPRHTAAVLQSLGQTHEAQGQLADAGRAYRRALNVLERTDAPRLARDVLHQLARVTAAQGDQSAVALYEQTRDATREWGSEPELGEVLCELADVHRDAERLVPAVQNYQAALECQPAPPFVRERAQTLRNLGRAYAQMERYDEARTVWTEALELSGQLPDQSPLELALTHHAIGEAYRSQERFEDAEQSYREALAQHTADTVAAAATWRALGQAMLEAGQPGDAIQPLQNALEVEKAQPQQVNARLVQTLQLLARAQQANRNLEAAIARYHEALVYMERALQPVAYADTLRTLATLYVEHRNYSQAHVALKEALDIENGVVPRSDERLSLTLKAIADTYRAQGDLEQAAEFYQRVTAYHNLARHASEDLRDTLNELDRRRATLQAAQQSLALLDRNDQADLKDLAFVYALIARSHALLNQPQESAGAIHALLDSIEARQDELDNTDARPDYRALALLASVRPAQDAGDLDTAGAACETAANTVTNDNLRWVVRQVMRALD